MLELLIVGASKKESKIIRLKSQQTEYLISRDSKADICLEDLSVSRKHTRIVCKNDSYYFVDLASTSGNLLNNSPIEANKEYLLKLGDSIEIGQSILVVTDIHINAPATIVTKSTKPDENNKVTEVTALSNGGWWKKGEIKVDCVKIFDETADAKTFSFKAANTFFDYKAGQFITLILDIDGEEVLRSYSISSTPSRPHLLEITVKRVPGGKVSNWLHDHLKVGSQISIDGPNGKFTCVDVDHPKVLMISAGSGITPMMSMSRWFFDTASTRDIVFFHSARSPKDIIFRHELELMSSNNLFFQLFVSTTRPKAGHPWLGLQGRLNPAILSAIAPDFLERMIYVCGPHEFMSATKHMMVELKFPMQNYYEESFGGTKSVPEGEVKPSDKPSFKDNLRKISSTVERTVERKDLTSISQEPAIPSFLPKSKQSVVLFKKAGKQVSCEDEETILEMALREEVKIRYSCRAGSCGSCKKMKLAGEVKYKSNPEALDESEINEGFILTCISIPIGIVEVDA